MGLWKEHFHWAVLLRWDVLAWITGFILAIGGLLLVFDQFSGANICFMFTACFVFAKIAHLAITSSDPAWHRLAFTFVLFGLIGIAIVETVRGVNSWRLKHEPKITTTAVEDEKIKSLASTDSFSAELLTAMYAQDREHAAGIWLRYSGAHGDTISPVNAALYLRITNAQTVPVTISSYSIDSKNANGDWVRLAKLPTLSTIPYVAAGNLKDATRLRDDTQFLDRLLQDHSLQGRESIVGWAFYEYPRANSFFRFVPQYRITILGTTGEHYVEELINTPGDDSAQSTHFFIVPENVDLSRLYQKYWSDAP